MFRFIKLKKVWIPVLLVVLIGVWVNYQRQQGLRPQYITEAARRQNLKQTVSATGTVEAAQDVKLNFKTTGRLVAINVKVGDQVKPSDRLASLDSRDAQSAVLTAEANLKSAEASLGKLRAGAQSESVTVSRAAVAAAQTTLDNTKQALVNTIASQDQAVTNALAQLVGIPAAALPAKDNYSTTTLSISGTYQGSDLGSYTIKVENSGPTYSVYGLETVVGVNGSRTTPTSLGTRGLKVLFSASGTLVGGETWTVEVPNTAASTYSSLAAAYQAALTTKKQTIDAAEATVRSAEQSLAQAQASLALVLAPPRTYDIQSAEAAVESARGALFQAQTNLSDRTIIAPVAGTITQVNNEVGETTSLTGSVIVLLAAGNQEVKVQVPESDIAKLKVGQAADMTLDAFGSSEHFPGHLSFVNPASTVVSDVVYYEVTVLFDSNDDRLKPGMTANVDVTSAAKPNVLVVPLRGVKYDNSRQPYVEVLQAGQVQRKQVTLGLRGDDGLVEVVGGVQEGEAVITFQQVK